MIEFDNDYNYWIIELIELIGVTAANKQIITDAVCWNEKYRIKPNNSMIFTIIEFIIIFQLDRFWM